MFTARADETARASGGASTPGPPDDMEDGPF